MDSRKYVLKETLIIAIGQVICVGIMLAVFAMLGRLDRSAVLGGIVGGSLSLANFFFMAVGASLAADRAESQNVNGGKGIITGSYLIRMIALFVILFACAKSGWFNVFALVIPLAFNQPIMYVSEFFRKKGGPEA